MEFLLSVIFSRGKGIFAFDFYEFIFTINVYLLDLYDLAFFLYFAWKLWRNILCNIRKKTINYG